jgi:deazaflavin-dependent oxidoreductase (nitroreductase family)
MRKAFVIVWAVIGLTVGFAAWWRRHPRTGAAWVNRVADPWLIREGVIAGTKGELGLIEHLGRKSGTVRVTPIRPVSTDEGFRIVVPLGVASQWARNVLAAGHCRLQVGEVVHELDEPRLVMPSEIEELPRRATRAMDWLGFRYLLLRRFAEHPGTLTSEPTPAIPEVIEPAPAEAVPA